MRLDPVAQELRRERDPQRLAIEGLELHRVEPARIDLVAELRGAAGRLVFCATTLDAVAVVAGSIAAVSEASAGSAVDAVTPAAADAVSVAHGKFDVIL